MIDYTEVGESYDMIIGVDGSRVTNFADFEERMRNVQPGELVYFSVVRNGKRIQIPVTGSGAFQLRVELTFRQRRKVTLSLAKGLREAMLGSAERSR